MQTLESRSVSVPPPSILGCLFVWAAWIFLAADAVRNPDARTTTKVWAILMLCLAAVLVFGAAPYYWLADLKTAFESVRFALILYFGVGGIYLFFSRK